MFELIKMLNEAILFPGTKGLKSSKSTLDGLLSVIWSMGPGNEAQCDHDIGMSIAWD